MIGFDQRLYGDLLVRFQPRPIRSSEGMDEAQSVIDELLSKPKLTAEENELLGVMTTLLEEWERSNVVIPRTDPLEMVRFLLEQAGERQRELVPIFGTESIVSAVLNGHRDLQRKHIEGLAQHFHVSPAVFFDV